jgi:hypothetical protein
VIVLSHPEWWVEHGDELLDGLAIAAQSPDASELDFPGADELLADADKVVIVDPAWWLDHVDELIDGLSRAVAEREAEQEQEQEQELKRTQKRSSGGRRRV